MRHRQAQHRQPSPRVERRRLPPDILSGVRTLEYGRQLGTPLKVGLAPLGVVLIEFPANDIVYRVSEANKDYVTVDHSIHSHNDPVILRPGSGFRVLPDRRDPMTIVTVQTSSGMVVPIEIYPVESISQNTTRLVLIYNRDEVVAARRRQGLPVNFPVPGELILADAPPSQPTPQPTPTPAATAQTTTSPSLLTAARGSDVQAAAPIGASEGQPPPRTQMSPVAYTTSAIGPLATDTLPTTVAPFDESARAVLRQQAQAEIESVRLAPRQRLTSFGRSLHGLSLATSRSRELDSTKRIVIIAVRNTLREPVRLVPNQPDIVRQTRNANRVATNNEPVARLLITSTHPDDNLPPGVTAYFAVIYETPILGAQQFLQARVAQIFAADAPANVDLAINNR